MLEPGARGQQNETTTSLAGPLALLLGVTVVVLLVVCSNVANLLLARGAARASEMAIRAAIGADRGRLIAQLLAESAVLALLGGLASLPIAALTVSVIAAFVPAAMTAEVGTGIGPAVIAFAAAISLATVLAFGAAPAIAASRAARPTAASRVSDSLSSRGTTRFQGILTTSQIALSVVLLVLAALFAQSLANIGRADLGLAVESLVTFNVAPARNGYGPERSAAVYERVEATLAAQPGVASVASATIPLLSSSGFVRGTTRSRSSPPWASSPLSWRPRATFRPGGRRRSTRWRRFGTSDSFIVPRRRSSTARQRAQTDAAKVG